MALLKVYVNEFRRQMGSKSSEFLELKDNKLIVHDKTLPGKLAAGLWDVAKLPMISMVQW